ncbi:DUF1573 domain-containing protein [Segatella copri]|jgi:hypothetical protein|uniref:DUF1573 domain-containing protein n=1 Tax=Segatella copri TaxID=165179 RepID=UPI001931A5BD|nr:DUF1573 domain-containing protein [Segatella copri]MBM0144582.1 DUF1573 domain-containing protein [Segatella copri]
MKRMNILMLSALLALPASAQKIATQHEVVDCGQVVFRHPVTAEFMMKNEGNRPLVIHNMLKSCGCTEVQYPKKSIAAGESFVVKAVYDAKQMGTFNKQVCLYTNAADEPFILTMRGKVVSNVVDFAGPYDEMLGEIKSDAQEVEFDDVNRGDRPVQRIHIFNPTEQMMEPVVMHLPSYLQAQVSPSKVAPHRAAEVILMLDSKKLRDFGLNQTSIYLGERPGDKIAPEKEIVVSSVLLPAFENMTAEKKEMAPKAELSTTDLDLGSFGSKKKLKGEVLITNNGKSTLEIRSMQMFTMGLQVNLKKSKIEPGESVKMKVTVVKADLKKSRAKKNPRILMITNDPDNAKIVVKIHVH